MTWLTDLIKERKAKNKAAADAVDEPHEAGTRRGEQRECFVIDPVTKQPADVSCDTEGAMEK